MRNAMATLVVATTLMVALSLRAEEDTERPSTEFAVDRFYKDLRHLVRRQYPEATAHRLGDKIHFEHDTRIFVVHEPLKTGEWQDPWEVRGPKKGGILCDIEFREGRYLGQAAVPQTFDKRYFKVMLLAPHSAKLGGHLLVRLRLPSVDAPPPAFRKELIALFNGFERWSSE